MYTCTCTNVHVHVALIEYNMAPNPPLCDMGQMLQFVA